MLYLVTGGMGAGKTVFTLKWVRDLQLATNRPVVMHLWTDPKDGVRKPRITLKDEGLTFGWQAIEFEDWEKQPDGTIFIIDECHEVMPTRTGPGSKVPSHIQALAAHRHRGFDFFLITQHPKNMDAFVRRLIADPGWHRHLKRRNGSQFVAQLEWASVYERCEKPDSGKTATIAHIKYPTEVFDWYVSTSLDTAKFRIPKQLYIIIAALIAVPLFIFAVVMYLRGIASDEQQNPAPQSTSSSLSGATLIPSMRRSTDQSEVLNAEQLAQTFMPRFLDQAYSAPRYDELTKPKRAPYPAACVIRVAQINDCKCYTQDATPYHTSIATCQRIAREGVFLDWQEASIAVSPLAPAVAAERTPQAAAPAMPTASEPVKEPALLQHEYNQQQELDRHMHQLAIRNAGPRLQGTLSTLRP